MNMLENIHELQTLHNEWNEVVNREVLEEWERVFRFVGESCTLFRGSFCSVPRVVSILTPLNE